MFVYHSIVCALFYAVFVKCDVVSMTSEKTWDEAVHFCKSEHSGTLSSVEEIQKSVYTEWENAWTLSSTLTKWLSFIGCFYLADKEAEMTFDLDHDATKRCSDGCDSYQYIGIRAKRHCICLSEQEILNKSIEWEACHEPGDEPYYIVYRKYGTTLEKVLLKNDLSDIALNCGAVSCKKKDRNTTYFFPENCTSKMRILCDPKESRHRLTWTNGIQHCLGKNQPPQSFMKYCQKHDGKFRKRGESWIGMFRPLGKDSKPFKECTYWSNDSESANCTRRLPFFCTGKVILRQPSTLNPTHPTSPNMSDDRNGHEGGHRNRLYFKGKVILRQPSTLNPTHPTSPNMSDDRNGHEGGHRNRLYIKVMISVVVVLVVVLLAVIVVVCVLCRRTKKQGKHIAVQKQTQEHNEQIKMKMNSNSQERAKGEENFYEFAEIGAEKDNDNKSKSCRDFKCPLPPAEMPFSASKVTGTSVSNPEISPLCSRKEGPCSKDSRAEAAVPCNHVGDQAVDENDHYDSFSSPRLSNDGASDTYDHAKIVQVRDGTKRVILSSPESSPTDADAPMSSKVDDKGCVYDLAKVIENEYDELVTPTKHIENADQYDNVTLNALTK